MGGQLSQFNQYLDSVCYDWAFALRWNTVRVFTCLDVESQWRLVDKSTVRFDFKDTSCYKHFKYCHQWIEK